uniref:Nuclear pore protein n=2 Tax=Ornithodoros turicata TaxID=34597 RepID=A0A2R5LLL6_9ACAR
MEEDSTGFGDLLQQAQQLTADIDGYADLPRVQRNLKQILEEGQQLWARTTQLAPKDTTDVKASILLGSKGFDLPKVSQKLDSLSVAKTFEPIEPIQETDIQGFLRNERENAILSVIEESTKTTLQESDKFYWDVAFNNWQKEKQNILNSLLGSSQEVMDVSIPSASLLPDTSINMKTRSTMSNAEIAYAREVFLYNEQVVQGGMRPNLASRCKAMAKEIDDKNAVDLWDMVCYLTEVPLQTARDTYAERTSAVLQAVFIRQARKYLERSYMLYMQMIVFGNLNQAALGGVPGTLNLVRGFLNVRLPPGRSEDGIVEGHPVWAVIYYCLRCGEVEAALEAANKAGNSVGDIASYLSEYLQSPDHRLNPSSEGQVRLQYARSVRASSDQFKRAVYCILGGCDVTDDHPDVATKVEDYLWLRLCQVHLDDAEVEASQHDHLTLSRLQTLLLEEHGETHFDAYHQPFLYFKVLFLTAQFEAAIDFLSRLDNLRCHAVHIAIVLYESNLLLTPSSIHVAILSAQNGDSPPTRRLNFARLLMTYTRKFESTDPREALQYFYFLRNLKGLHSENLFVACISELVLETREFEALLGKLEADGSRKHGAVDCFLGDTQRIVEAVATDSEKRGLYEDAVKLYDLAGKHEEAVRLLNKLLGQVVPQQSTAGSTRERVETLAVEIAKRYRTNGSSASTDTMSTLYLLLDLATFFNQAHSGKKTQALETMQKLNLLPFSTEEVETKVTNFSLFTEEIRCILADVLLATMNLLHTQYKELRSGGTSGTAMLSGRGKDTEGQLLYLRMQARALITFAGMIPYRMPGDTNARLVQMEVLMT